MQQIHACAEFDEKQKKKKKKKLVMLNAHRTKTKLV